MPDCFIANLSRGSGYPVKEQVYASPRQTVARNAKGHHLILAEGQKGTLSEVNEYYKEAARLGALVAPYRRARLSAIKLAGDPNAGTGTFKPDATLEELREELGKRVVAMAQAGLIDLAALPQPEPETSN